MMILWCWLLAAVLTLYAFEPFQGKLITTISVGEIPKGVRIHPDGDIAFVANEGSGTISAIDTETWMEQKRSKWEKFHIT